MEGSGSMTNGTTLSNGVATPIRSSFGSSEGVRSAKTVSNSQKAPVSITEFREAKQAKESDTSNAEEQFVEKVKSESSEADFAENLIILAKRRGVDAAFEELASDEEKKKKEKEQEKVEAAGEDTFEGIEEIKRDDEKQETQESEIPIESQIKALERRVDQMANESREFAKKADEALSIAKDGISTALELATILRQLIEMEEEEKRKKKQDLLEALAKLIAKMITMITVSDEAQKELKEEEKEKAA